jgi:tetratricopeptide (TPR) repeat protein
MSDDNGRSDSDADDDRLSGTLELRLRVDRAYGISRDVGLAWFEAARYGDAKTIKRLLGEAAQKDRSDRAGGLSSSSSSSAVERLLHYNGQATSYGFVGSTALHWACATGDMATAEVLLAAGAAVNTQNFGGSTPLHSACANGQPEMVALLLRHGANPAVVDCCGDRPQDVLSHELAAADANKVTALLSAHRTIEQMINAVGGASGLAGSATAATVPWSAADMRALLVAVGSIKSAAEAPKDAIELRKAALEALRLVSAVRARSEIADRKAAALHAKVAKRLDAQRQKALAAYEADGSDGDEAGGQRSPPFTTNPQKVPKSLRDERNAAEDAKSKGNAAYAAGEYKAAIKWYTTAIAVTGGTAADDATFYSNRAATYAQLGQHVKALEDGRKAVALKPGWAKGYHRIGTAACALGQYEDAAAAFRAGLALVPGDESLLRGLEVSVAGLLDAADDGTASPPPNFSSVPHPQQRAEAKRPPKADLNQFAPGERKPWFECALCDNRTRDHAASPCCGLLVCGTCAKRRFGGGQRCPFACS